MTVPIRAALAADYDQIAAAVDGWWGRPIGAALPRLFLDHFHRTSLVAEDTNGLAGFLVGFPSPDQPDVAYLHFVGVRPDRRGSGLGRALYETFFALVRAAGRHRVHAITAPTNSGSVRFHERLGFTVSGPVEDYNGPGRPALRFALELR